MIIGLVGLAGSGKDTVADMLQRFHGFRKVAFADPLKRIARDVYAFSDDQLWGPSEFRNAPDMRYPRGPKVWSYPFAPKGAVWIPLANDKGYTLIDAEDFDLVTSHRWHLSAKGEDKRTDYVKGPGDVKLHAFLMKPAPGSVVDHMNGDGLDNRRANLRVCTSAENRRNEPKRAASSASSPFKGVSWDASREKWTAKITIEGATKNLGRFDRAEQAALAYDAAAREAFGKFARLNADEFLTPRYALQNLGTEFGRDCYADTWVDMGIRIARELLDPNGGKDYDAKAGVFRSTGPPPAGVVFSDCRFLNEERKIKAAGGKVVRIVRPGAGLAGAAGLHPSEVEQLQIKADVEIVNAGTLDELKANVCGLVESILSE